MASLLFAGRCALHARGVGACKGGRRLQHTPRTCTRAHAGQEGPERAASAHVHSPGAAPPPRPRRSLRPRAARRLPARDESGEPFAPPPARAPLLPGPLCPCAQVLHPVHGHLLGLHWPHLQRVLLHPHGHLWRHHLPLLGAAHERHHLRAGETRRARPAAHAPCTPAHTPGWPCSPAHIATYRIARPAAVEPQAARATLRAVVACAAAAAAAQYPGYAPASFDPRNCQVWGGEIKWGGGNSLYPLEGTHVYYMGMDPIWHGRRTELSYFNSVKMKMSIILGVTHMDFGILNSLYNSLYWR